MSETEATVKPETGPAEAPRQNGSMILVISAPPHVRCRTTVPQTMLWVLAALVPAAGIAVAMSGLHALYSMLLSIAAATVAESAILFFIRRKPSIPDGSAALTGLLVALSLPPLLPLWMAPVGSLFAIALVKMAFGGLGRNFLNPALAGRAFLVAAFPALFGTAAAVLPVPAGTPEITTALLNFLTGYQSGWMGGISAGALLIGAILLWSLRIIDFALPLSFIGTVFLFSWCTGNPGAMFSTAGLLFPLFQVLGSGLLFGAFFLATDPVTSPTTARARLIFGIGCGVLMFLFQKSAPTDNSIMQAILVMNFTVPWMDRYLMHRSFGTQRIKSAPGKTADAPLDNETISEPVVPEPSGTDAAP